MNEFILYNTDDGSAEIKLILDHETKTVWLSQKQMAELFDVSVKTVNEHIINIYKEAELEESSTIRNFRIVQREGSRDVEREVTHYNLRGILAVGFRVQSPRGTQFRKWAATTLDEYLVKGFVMNDQRLKDGAGWDYFDELLERIRDIRASEKRFYQKIKDLFVETSIDYDSRSEEAQTFFKTIQNKLLFAETGKTAAELITERADSNKKNMGLTNWKGKSVRKDDIATAKNYLTEAEVTSLNRIVTMFLDFAEDRASRRKQIAMKDWLGQADQFLQFNERNLLEGAGRISHNRMLEHVSNEYDQFQKKRAETERKISNDEFERELSKLKK